MFLEKFVIIKGRSIFAGDFMITKETLLKQLSEFQSSGKPVIVHSSLKSIGEIEGRGEVLLEALIEHFTKDGGILCVPTHTWRTCVLDLSKAESCLGKLPEIAAGHKDGLRSLHPTHSMTVFGDKKRCENFIKNEINVDSPTNPDGCYGNIFKENGFVLLIGVGQEKNTCIHCVDEMLEIPHRLTKEGIYADIIYKDGKTEKRHLRWFDPIIPDVSVNFGKLEPAFRHFNAIKDGKIGNADVQFCRTDKIKEAMEVLYKNAAGKELLADNLPLDEKLYK